MNIETDIDTNINVNMGGGAPSHGGGGSSHGGHHFKPNGEVATDQWGWPIWDGGNAHTDDNVDKDQWGWPIWDGGDDNISMDQWGWPVWDGGEEHTDNSGEHSPQWGLPEDHPEFTVRDVLSILGGKLGINNPQDMMARLDKEEVKTLLVNFLNTLKKENDFNHEHNVHHDDTNKPGTDKPKSPIDNESGGKPKSPVDNES